MHTCGPLNMLTWTCTPSSLCSPLPSAPECSLPALPLERPQQLHCHLYNPPWSQINCPLLSLWLFPCIRHTASMAPASPLRIANILENGNYMLFLDSPAPASIPPTLHAHIPTEMNQALASSRSRLWLIDTPGHPGIQTPIPALSMGDHSFCTPHRTQSGRNTTAKPSLKENVQAKWNQEEKDSHGGRDGWIPEKNRRREWERRIYFLAAPPIFQPLVTMHMQLYYQARESKSLLWVAKHTWTSLAQAAQGQSRPRAHPSPDLPAGGGEGTAWADGGSPRWEKRQSSKNWSRVGLGERFSSQEGRDF